MSIFFRDLSPDHVLTAACHLIDEGKRVAIATVIETWGSSPRPVGSQLVISDADDLFGSVSGGCVEGAVLLEAQAALKNGQCRLLDYGIANDDVFAAGLSCGGHIQILVEPVGIGQGLEEQMLRDMAALERSAERYVYEVNLDQWSRKLHNVTTGFDQAALATVSEGKSTLEGSHFYRLQDRPLRLYVVGAVHIAQYLCPMARMVGYDVTLIDNRGLFAQDNRFDGVTIIEEWPSDVLADAGLDDRCAVVTLTHDPKFDLPSLEVALQSDCFYIGALGSRKTHADRIAKLAGKGYIKPQLDRINGPVGLAIGSKSPAEIALSISAQLVAIQRGAVQRLHKAA